jgi:hypothetical protein
VVPDRLPPDSDEHRVLQFRPRSAAFRRLPRSKLTNFNGGPRYSPVPDLAKYESAHARDDYRNRMVINAIAFIYIGLLILAGVWIVTGMAHHA